MVDRFKSRWLHNKKMRKALFIILAFMITSFNVKAVPSYPYPISYTQPDGSVVTLQLRGDEFDHKVLIDGVSCTLAPDGFWRPVSVPPSTKSVFQTPTRKTRQNSEPKLSPSICKGEKRFLVLLVEFQDLKFTTNKNYFVKTLNEKGYSEGGATGSAYDYFCDNSSEQFKPTFDIVGPISLSEKYSYYGENDENGNDKNAHMALYNACQIAQKNSLVDFSKYDNDGDGYVDNVFFYFAGYSEAEGANPSTIWPHAWYLESGAGKTLSINGKKIDRYACTAELNGNKGSTPSGIGVFCHEFSHVLGLPDLYDTDYEKSGNARTVNIWSIMSNGAYLNESMTPPYFMGVERERLGWVKITPLTKEGEITIAPIQTNICYSTTTSKKDEIFLYEYRNGAKWDTYIPKGLAVMHKDASTRDVNGFTAATRWATGSGINSYGDHPCGYLVWANPTATNIYQYPFPGSNNIRFFEGVDWNGKATSFQFSNIRITEEGIKATLSLDKEKKLFGVVTDNEGVPIEGAEISLNLLETATKAYLSPFSAKRLTTAKSGSLYYTTTDEQGSYSILLEGEVETEFEMTVSCRGYIGKNENVSIASGSVNRDFSLTPFTHSKEGSIVLYNYQPSSVVGGLYVLRWNKKTDDYLVGTTFKSSALAKYVGARLDSIFILCPAVGITSGEVVVDYDG